MEAELVALGEATREAMLTHNLLTELMQTQWCKNVIEIRSDNQSAIRFAEKQSSSERTKHLDLRKFFIWDAVEKGYLRSNRQ